MGDLACDPERVPMEGHETSFICEDDPVLLEEVLPPAGQILCSCGELHYGQDGTHQQCMDGNSVQTEVDISGCTSSEIKTGKEGDGNSQSHVASENSEQKESSSFEPSPSFLANYNPPVLHDPGPSSPDDIGDLEPEVVDCDTCGGQEPNCGSGTGFMREMLDEPTSSHQASF